MNKIDIQDRISVINTRLDEMVGTCEQEQRRLDENETNEKASLLEERSRLEQELNTINSNFKEMNENEKRFSLLEAIRTVANGGRIEGDYADEVRAMASKSGLAYTGQIQMKATAPELRTPDGILTGTNNYTSGTYNGGHEMVATDVLPIIEELYNNTVLEKAGANFYNGLVGDAKLPIIGNTTFGFKAENAAADNVTPNMGKVELTPKRLTGFIYLSKQLLNQTGQDIEAKIRQNIAKAIAQAVESAILGYGSSPRAGIMNGATAVTAANLTYALLAQTLEPSVQGSNFNPTVVLDPTVAGILKTTACLSGGTYPVMQNGLVDGLPTYMTNNIKSAASSAYALALADFSQLHIGTWGDLLDIVVDPYSRAAYGEIVLTLNYYCDWGWTSTSAYAVRKVTLS